MNEVLSSAAQNKLQNTIIGTCSRSFQTARLLSTPDSLLPIHSVLSKYSTELVLNDFSAANTDDFHTYLMVFLKKLSSWSHAIKNKHALLLRKRLSDHLFTQETRKMNLYITKLEKSQSKEPFNSYCCFKSQGEWALSKLNAFFVVWSLSHKLHEHLSCLLGFFSPRNLCCE